MDSNEEEFTAPKEFMRSEPSTVSLQKLWRKTCFLFWQYPLLLWSPILVADIAKYWVEIAATRIAHAVIYTLAQHSVLSTGIDLSPTGAHFAIIAMAAGIVTWISYAFAFFLYSLAFIFIANSVRKLTIQPDQISRLQGSRIVATALKLTFLLTCLSLAIALLSGWVYSMFPVTLFQDKRLMPILLLGLASVASIFAARPFLRAASPNINKPQPFASRTIVLTWFLLSGGLLSSTLLSFALMHANISFPSHPFAGFNYLLGILISVIGATPYIPMMIGIALLAQGNKNLEMPPMFQN